MLTGLSDPSHLMSRFLPEDERPGDARCIVLSCLPSELCLPLGMPCLADSMSFFRFLLPAPHCMMSKLSHLPLTAIEFSTVFCASRTLRMRPFFFMLLSIFTFSQ